MTNEKRNGFCPAASDREINAKYLQHPTHHKVYTFLAMATDYETGECNESYRGIACQTGLKLAAVRRTIAYLIKNGLLKVSTTQCNRDKSFFSLTHYYRWIRQKPGGTVGGTVRSPDFNTKDNDSSMRHNPGGTVGGTVHHLKTNENQYLQESKTYKQIISKEIITCPVDNFCPPVTSLGPQERTVGSLLWDCYSEGYKLVFGYEPKRDIKTNAICKSIGETYGIEAGQKMLLIWFSQPDRFTEKTRFSLEGFSKMRHKLAIESTRCVI